MLVYFLVSSGGGHSVFAFHKEKTAARLALDSIHQMMEMYETHKYDQQQKPPEFVAYETAYHRLRELVSGSKATVDDVNQYITAYEAYRTNVLSDGNICHVLKKMAIAK